MAYSKLKKNEYRRYKRHQEKLNEEVKWEAQNKMIYTPEYLEMIKGRQEIAKRIGNFYRDISALYSLHKQWWYELDPQYEMGETAYKEYLRRRNAELLVVKND